MTPVQTGCSKLVGVNRIYEPRVHEAPAVVASRLPTYRPRNPLMVFLCMQVVCSAWRPFFPSFIVFLASAFGLTQSISTHTQSILTHTSL